MAAHTANELLSPDDTAPFGLFNAAGRSPFLLIGDHAGSAIPSELGDLGVSAADRQRHIALDIGVFGLGHALARLLDAPFLHQVYSRLVIDCNRDPAHASAMPTVSDGTGIPGNEGLDTTARKARIDAIHRPYHDAIGNIISQRSADGQGTVLISLHSFTPVMNGVARPWDVGILHWTGQLDFALRMLESLRTNAGLIVGDNVPYAMDETDYTVPRHAFPNRLPYVEIEVRQDAIGNASGQERWADTLSKAMMEAL